MTLNPIDGLIIPYAGVLYQTHSPITDDMRVLCLGNSKGNQSRPYIQIPKEVLSKTENLLKERNTCKEAYHKVNALSGGVYESSTQSKLRNLKQVYRQKEEMKPKTKPTDSHEPVALIRHQQDNTFNLCKNWLSNTCYKKYKVEKSRRKAPYISRSLSSSLS